MSKVRQKDTDIEQEVRSRLHRRGMRFLKHRKELPGRPDVVFTRARLVVFLDGDFWHGHRFEEKKAGMAPYWREKIARNIERDNRNFANLRSRGWRVLRFWQHEIKQDPEAVVDKITEAYHRQLAKEQERPGTTSD